MKFPADLKRWPDEWRAEVEERVGIMIEDLPEEQRRASEPEAYRVAMAEVRRRVEGKRLW